MKTIKIVHLADMHVKQANKLEFKKRVDAFIKDLKMLCPDPDAVIVSGDVSYSGQSEEFDIAHNELFAVVAKKFTRQIYISMGNHDVCRTKVKDVFQSGIVRELESGNFSVLQEDSEYQEIERSFNSFCDMNGYVRKDAVVQDVNDVKLGVSILNSTRSCLKRESNPGQVAIPIECVNAAVAKLDDCAVRIAVFHHPFKWFMEGQSDATLPEIQHGFDIILNGHVHDGVSAFTESPDGSYVQFTVASFFRGSASHRVGAEGYNIYEIEPNKHELKAIFRKYVSNRHEYDKDTDSAKDGEKIYCLPSDTMTRQKNFPVLVCGSAINKVLKAESDKGLSQVQRIDRPVYVAPNVCPVTAESNGRIVCQSRHPDFNGHLQIFFAPPDVGSTMFFLNMCQEINISGGVACILPARRFHDLADEGKMLSDVAKRYDLSEETLNIECIDVFVDDFELNDVELLRHIQEVCKNTKRIFVCVKNRVLFETIVRGNLGQGVSFYEFQYWGANKLKEFIEKFIEASGLDVSDIGAATQFIVKSFAGTDLPVTPFLAGMYLRIFFEGHGALVSLQFVELLENMEAKCFSGVSGTGVNTKHYYQQFLINMALQCLSSRSITVLEDNLVSDFNKKIDEYGLEGDASHFVDMLVKTGILVKSGTGFLSFGCYAFLRYYLALAFEQDDSMLKEAMKSVGSAEALGDSVAYYVYKHRSDKSLANDLISLLETCFPEHTEILPEQLEKYANDLLAPLQDKSNADEEAKRIVNAKIKSSEDDARFMESRASARTDEERGLQNLPVQNTIDKVAQNIGLLRMMYNVFRNLEQLKLTDKCELLKRILDFHLACNMQLIDLFVQTVKGHQKLTSLFAYLVTIGGTCFLSENIASENLKKAIKAVYKDVVNPLKRFLLICIEEELGMQEFREDLQSLISMSEDVSIIEMGYFKIREHLVRSDATRISKELITTFKKLFEIRNYKQGVREKARTDQMFNLEISNVQKMHVQYIQDKISGKTDDLEVLLKHPKS